jgi:hypothetical protein
MARPPASLTERIGVQVMRRQPSIAAVAPADDPVHLLTAEERSALRSIARHAVARAALAGALSALASGTAGIVAHRYYPTTGAAVGSSNFVAYWSWVVGVTVVASVFEIGFLYWDALRSVHRMACAAGLKFDSAAGRNDPLDVMGALARAALELPNPPEPRAGIDPRREASALFVLVASLLYKAKIALTTFVTKALVRSVLGRAAARVLLELVSVPVTAAWNAVVCHAVLTEAKLRILGPSAVVELLTMASASAAVTERGWQTAYRAAASAVVRTRDFHPNHLAVVRELAERISMDQVPQADDTSRFLHELQQLGETDQRFVLQVLVTAAVLDGRVSGRERQLLRQAMAACGRPLNWPAVRASLRGFRAGRPVMGAIEAAAGWANG